MSSLKAAFDNNTLRVTLADSATGNLLDDAMLNALLAAMDKWSDAAVLVIASDGPDFSIGRPKPKMSSGLPEDAAGRVRAALQLVHAVNMKLRDWPGATVGIVRGQAKGAAAGFLSNCDVVFAAPDATLGFPEMTYDLAPALVASYLPNRISARVAHYLLLTGEQIDAERALAWGIVHEIHAAEKLQARAEELVAFLASRAPDALNYCKRALYAFQHRQHEQTGPAGIEQVISWLSRDPADRQFVQKIFRNEQRPLAGQ